MCDEAAILPEPEQMYLRLRDAHRLDQEQLNVLQRLSAWRETTARTIDRPRKYVLTDRNLVDIARGLPDSRSALRGTTELHPRHLERQGATILQMVNDGLHSVTDAPDPPQPISGRERKLCSELQQIVLARAEALDVQATWLATRKDLESLIQSDGDFSSNRKLLGWRKAEIIDELATILKENKP